MLKMIAGQIYLCNGRNIVEKKDAEVLPGFADSGNGSMAARILSQHNAAGAANKSGDLLQLTFDALASHDITYVGIIQTAKASGLERFPVPYVLTNCHNSLCAVGGTINEDDHIFGLSAARKYGGIYVPAHQAVIHTYMREEMAACGKMILGSDSHTRYGALGTMAIGEGGPELVKQILGKTYDVKKPEIVLVYVTGTPGPGVGPQDVALELIRTVFDSGFVKNKVLEFVGPGIANLTVDFRSGVDVMTTETTCLSSIWETDGAVEQYFALHKRPDAYTRMFPAAVARYDGAVLLDLDAIKPMIALPFHPANAYTIEEFKANTGDILRKAEIEGQKALETPGMAVDFMSKFDGKDFHVDQGVIAGCSGGTFENIMAAAQILEGHTTGTGEFWLSVYPGSQPVNLELSRNGALSTLMAAGATLRTAFCGPCFGAGDVPAHQGFSIRHTTRNFPSREGSKPGNGQIASVALMDARSIAATAIKGGVLTGADEIGFKEKPYAYTYDRSPYDARVYGGFGKARSGDELKFGPNIAEWPAMSALPENLALGIVSVIRDPVTTTDELIPSGETSSYRSNPYKLAEFTLSRKDPGYVGRAKHLLGFEKARIGTGSAGGVSPVDAPSLAAFYKDLAAKTGLAGLDGSNTGIGSVVYANKPGDGSAREQAASCQKVLGGWGNIAIEYATKRYRSNLVNWGMLPFVVAEADAARIALGSTLLVTGLRTGLVAGKTTFAALLISDGKAAPIEVSLPGLEAGERDIILAGCLINYYAGK